MTASVRQELFSASLTLRRENSQSTKLLRFEVVSEIAELQIQIDIPSVSERQRESIQPDIRQALDRYYLEGNQDAGYAALHESDKQIQVQNHTDRLRHFISISLYDSQGMQLGRRDSRAPLGLSNITVGPHPSPGFHPSTIKKGFYTIAVEIAQILADEIEIPIKVFGYPTVQSNSTQHEPLHREEIEFSPPERFDLPNNSHWLDALVLVPTHHGEGKCSLSAILAESRRLGIDVLVVADVNSSVVWDEPLPDSTLLLHGQVFDTYKGRSAGLGLIHPILVNDAENPTDTQWLANRVHEEMGWYAILHPYALGEPIEPGMRWSHEDIDLASVDWLHVWSGPWKTRSPEIINALRLWDYLLSNGLRTCGFAADLNSLNDRSWPYNLPIMRIRTQKRDSSAICEALTSGQFICTTGPTIDISLATGSIVARTGQNAILDEGTTYKVVVDAAGYGRSAMLRIIRDGGLLVEMPLSSNGKDRKVFHAMATHEQTYYRAEIFQFGHNEDDLLALTNPVIQTTVPVWRNRPTK